jgi:hypothetical protein
VRTPVSLKGFKALKRKLDALPKRGARRANRKATRAGTNVILKAIRKATPVDTGLLRKAQAAKIIARRDSAAGIVGADIDKLLAGAATGDRPSNIDWLVENGHTDARGFFVPPSGYMRRAAAAAMPAAEAAYRSKLAQEIEREADKA